jgi:SpoIID/LytB domain protein
MIIGCDRPRGTILLAARLALLIAVSCPVSTQAQELGQSDKLKLLYSAQFSFDRRGVPQIPIAIADDLREASISSSKPLRVLPDGEDGAQVVGSKSWRVRLQDARAGVVEHFVILASRAPGSLREVQAEVSRWEQRGVRSRVIDVGAVFGTKGQVFDNRAHVVADGPYPSEDLARAAGEGYARKYELSPIATIPQLKQRPSATLIATDLKRSTSIALRDAIWFAAEPGATLSVQGPNGKSHAYRGQVVITVNARGKLALVNVVAADHLLAGLVPAEIFPSAPAAALQAQAVAARGDLLAKLGTRHHGDPYLICATQHCQVYRGLSHEDPRTSAAVAATRGVVLTRPNGGLVKAVYSASCGGHSEDNDHVWPVAADSTLRGRLDDTASRGPFAQGVTSQNIEQWLSSPPRAWCRKSGFNQDKFRWTVRYSAAQLDRLLRTMDIGAVKHIGLLERGRSGRARLMEITGAHGKKRIRGELLIRQTLGNLKSSMVHAREVRDRSGRLQAVELRGGGWGHGAGMCQTGAIGMAKAGKSYEQILRHYYSGVGLFTVY